MSNCGVLSGIYENCPVNLGGVKRIAFVSYFGIDSVSFKLGNFKKGIDTITLKSLHSFIEYKFAKNSVKYDVSHKNDSNRISEWEHSVDFKINRRNIIKNEELWNMFYAGQRLVALVLDANDEWWVLGLRTGLSLNSGSGSSGSVKADGSNYSYSLSGTQDYFELKIDAEDALTLLN